MTAPQVVLRLGTHAEKDYVEKLAPMLDGIIVGANLVEATPGATSSLILRLCGAKTRTAYYLDPMTYAFGCYIDQDGRLRTDLAWIKSEQLVKEKGKKKTVLDFKRSYKSLAAAFGGPFQAAVDNSRAISAKDVTAGNSAAKIARAIVEYQRSRIRSEFEADEEFKQYAEEVPNPAAVFAPYFYCEPSSRDEWWTANLRLTEESVKAANGLAVHAIVSVDAEVLSDSPFMKRLAGELPKTGVQGVWLWFSKFFEDDASLAELTALKEVVEALHKAGLAVFNMHGGYFSLALSKFGMTGISHGVGYGEQKDVVPVIGQGIPTVRYYLPALHKRLGVPDIERCFEALGIKTPADFHAKVCDCPVCKGIVRDDLQQFRAFGETQPSASSGLRLVQTPAAAKRCRFHFLIARLRECDRISKMSVADIRAMWQAAADSWGRQRVLAANAKHLAQWMGALE